MILLHVKPLLKKEDRGHHLNYKRISLISYIEIYVNELWGGGGGGVKHLYNFFFTPSNIFYKFQSAYRPQHSVAYQLKESHATICESLKKINKDYFCAVFLDMSKTIDSVRHKGLI